MTEFMEGFTQIGVLLKEMYQMITLGGNASLDLVDSLDPFSEGVSFGYVASTSERFFYWSNILTTTKTFAFTRLQFCKPVVFGRLKSPGNKSAIFLEVKKHWLLWHSSLLCIIIDLRLCT